MVECRHRAFKAPIIPIICEVSPLRILFWFNLVVLLFVLAIAPASVTAQQIALDPGVPVTLSFAGLHDTVSVRRDARGIPYIDAKNNDDLYFAQGYVTASDRLWQMDLLRRNARGELAEIFGPAVLEQDKLHRRYGFGRVTDAMVSKASPEAKSTLEAYARGVNAYIESLDATTLPPEFAILQYKPRPWAPADSLAVLKNFAEALSSTWTLDLMRAALARAPEAARKDLMPERSGLDVLVVGADRVDRKTEALNIFPDNNALET
ncbi:MAG: penicillin amidase, partial [Blastocatellia bacterium]|nr:penicillin amidase [Blastocatellia bacterium]